jgi:ketosteroid isomerase-like protein
MDAAAIRLERERALARLAGAYQRRDLDVFKEECRPDMRLTLEGNSLLAGTYHGYEAFADYLETLRTALSSAGGRIVFEHPSPNVMVFHQVMLVSGPQHGSEMPLDVIVTYAPDGRIASFDVRPDDQGLFDHIVDTALVAAG